MNIHLILLIITAIVFYGYLGVIRLLYGQLPSISESFYRLPLKYNWVFSIFLWTISVLLIWATWDTLLIVLAGFFIMGVGVFPYFRDERWMHYVCALTGIGCGLISLWVNFDELWLFVLCLASISWIKISNTKNLFYWIEVVAFTTILLGLITYYR